MKVPKWPISVINKLGLSISYPTITKAIQANGQACIEELKGRFRRRDKHGIMYDNVVQKDRVRKQSIINRSVLHKHTVVAVIMLKLPPIPEDAHCEADDILGVGESHAREWIDEDGDINSSLQESGYCPALPRAWCYRPNVN